MTEIEQRIASIIAQHAELEPAALSPASTMNDLDVPSIAQLEILFAIEEAFDVYFPDEDGNDGSTRTLSDLALNVQRMIDEKSAQ